MQDLTNDARFPAYLVPSSMSNGGEVHGNQAASLGATGSTPVSGPKLDPVPWETLPLPSLADAHDVGVNPQKSRLGPRQTDPLHVPDPPAHFAGATVGSGEDRPGGGWRLTPSAGGRP